jgi:hypothetical protein
MAARRLSEQELDLIGEAGSVVIPDASDQPPRLEIVKRRLTIDVGCETFKNLLSIRLSWCSRSRLSTPKSLGRCSTRGVITIASRLVSSLRESSGRVVPILDWMNPLTPLAPS